ncbi:MAG: hypothetical protein BGN97_00265 [Microbacterium sp. 69-10]|uniref:capsid assembly scaffolding protein Gp46 family protein n=1 Tax=Microbacterium sp. 69-10 TaxID=1895783 RepID=UPI000963CEBF|nr:DUF4355 domain-containing protein [Microbacterium sp. 69-10]OJU39689.1 MAG: hypothetical protein BGN97_00265 [Microbacterium sp. 69-10]
MAEETAQTTGTEETTNEQQQEQPQKFQAITSQEDFDKAIQTRIARERAKYSDYDQLKADAAELATIRDSQKTEAQKLQDERDQAKQEAATERSARLRAEVAADKGVPAALLSGSTQEELEASAAALIAFRGEQQNDSSRLHVENEGNQSKRAAADWLRDAVN